jgi:hypothetical protein
MSDKEDFVSPYLLRPCRSLQEVLREQEEQPRHGEGTGGGTAPARGSGPERSGGGGIDRCRLTGQARS